MSSSAGGVRAGKAFVEIGAKDDSLKAALASAQRRLESFGSMMNKVGIGFTAMGAAVVAPMFAAVKSFEAAGSELNDMSVRTGASVEALSALKYGAEQTGASLGGVESALRKTQKAITEAAGGSSTAADKFAALGLSVEALAAMSPEQQFEATAKAIAAIEDPTRRVAAATELWGRTGSALIPLALQYDELRNKAVSVNAIFSSAAAGAADALGDQFGDLRATVMGLSRSIGEALAPMMLEATRAATAAVKAIGDWVAVNKPAIIWAGKLALGITAVGGALTLAGTGAWATAKAIDAIVLVSKAGRAAALALAGANALLATSNFAVAKSSAVAQSITGVGFAKVVVGAGIAALAGLAISKLSNEYNGLKDSIEKAMEEQTKANAALGKTPGKAAGDAGDAGKVSADDDLANYMRVHNAKVALIEDEREKAIQGVFAKYYQEMEQAKKAGATAETLWSMLAARELELKKVNQDFDRKAHEEKLAHQRELEDAERQRLQRISDANADRIDTNAALELEASGKTGTDLARARLALERTIETRKAAAAGEDLKQVEREYKLKNEILDRQDQMNRVAAAMRAASDAVSKIDAVGKFGGMNLNMILGGRTDDNGRKIDETNKLLRRVVDNTEVGLTFA